MDWKYCSFNPLLLYLLHIQIFEATIPGKVDADLPERPAAAILKIKPVFDDEVPEEVEIQKLKIFACFEVEQTTVTTTPSGVPTMLTTTTKFTSTGATQTTVITTLQPEEMTGILHTIIIGY